MHFFVTDKGDFNTAIGKGSLAEAGINYNVLDFSYNTAIGYRSGYNMLKDASNGSAQFNTFLGPQADVADSSQSYSYSTAIGANAKIDASHQIVLGTSDENIIIPGKLDVSSNATFSDSVIISDICSNVFISNITESMGSRGKENVAIGVDAFINSNDNCIRNTSIGTGTMFHCISGKDNTCLGKNAFFRPDKGDGNTAIGKDSLAEAGINYNVLDFSYNTAIGYRSGYNMLKDASNGSAQFNTFLGPLADVADRSQSYSYSTAIGANAKIDASHQIVLGTSDENIVIPGKLDVSGNATFSDSVIISDICSNVFISNVTESLGSRGKENVAIGVDAFINSNDNCRDNTSIGTGTMNSCISGKENTCLGKNAFFRPDKGDGNTAIGTGSLGEAGINYSVLDFSYNTAIGYRSGYNMLKNATSGSAQFNTFLGPQADVADRSQSYSYSTAIGANAKIDASNQIVLGTVNENVLIPGELSVSGDVEGQSFNATSDARYKDNICDLENSLEKICSIRGVNYNWVSDENEIKHGGVIAQEISEQIPEAVNTCNPEKLSVDYNAIIGHLIESVKTLKMEIEMLKLSK